MDDASRSVALRATMAVAWVATLVMNGIHGANGDMRDAAHAHMNLLTPADSYFAIFIPINILVTGFVARECVWPSTHLPTIQSIYVLFILSCPFNVLYMECLIADAVHWAFAAIFVLWLLLFRIYILVEDGVRPIVITTLLYSTNASHPFASSALADVVWVRTAFTVYWAWICAGATIALNVSVDALGFHALPVYVFWCGLWVLANSVILVGTGDVPFAVVGFYALVGIAHGAALRAARLVPQNPNYVEHVAICAMASAGALVFGGLFSFLVLHKWWRGGAAFPTWTSLRLLAQDTKGSYGTLG